MADRVSITKTFLPPLEEYEKYLQQIWRNDQLTNQGPLLHELEHNLQELLGVEYLHFVTNGTIALQLAMQVLSITAGEVITTPFTYVATTSAIMWQRCTPVYVDIDPATLCIDPAKLEAAITPRSKAVLPVHVFGNACDVEAISDIAERHNLKVIYDAAHAFGVRYKGRSLVDYGDVSTCSFHATKLFHTIEGGCVITRDQAAHHKLELTKRFGHHGDNHFMPGINAKASEFQAAMGLCNLRYVNKIIAKRGEVAKAYDTLLADLVDRPTIVPDVTYNNAYYPVLLENETELLEVLGALNSKDIFPRRYFYPSLNTLPYVLQGQTCPVSEDIASRILCLPLYIDLGTCVIETIEQSIREVVHG